MTSRYGSDHANKAAVRAASGFVPVTGVAAVRAARCPVIDVCTTPPFHVAVSPAAQQKQFSAQLIGLLSEHACQKHRSITLFLRAAVAALRSRHNKPRPRRPDCS